MLSYETSFRLFGDTVTDSSLWKSNSQLIQIPFAEKFTQAFYKKNLLMHQELPTGFIFKSFFFFFFFWESCTFLIDDNGTNASGR